MPTKPGKIIERIKERRREIRESTTERARHTRRTVKEIMEKKAVNPCLHYIGFEMHPGLSHI